LFEISDGGILDLTPASFDALVFSILLLFVQYIIYFITKKIKHIRSWFRKIAFLRKFFILKWFNH